jgi:hypothetical protein
MYAVKRFESMEVLQPVISSFTLKDDERLDYYPELLETSDLPLSYLLSYENNLYIFADKHIQNYGGGFWEYVVMPLAYKTTHETEESITLRLSVLSVKGDVVLHNPDNYFEQLVHPITASVALNIYLGIMTSHSLGKRNPDLAGDVYDYFINQRNAWLAILPEKEASAIYRFLD